MECAGSCTAIATGCGRSSRPTTSNRPTTPPSEVCDMLRQPTFPGEGQSPAALNLQCTSSATSTASDVSVAACTFPKPISHPPRFPAHGNRLPPASLWIRRETEPDDGAAFVERNPRLSTLRSRAPRIPAQYCRHSDDLPCATGNDPHYGISARSRHTGGVHVVLGDGAVRFVGNSVDIHAWRALSTKGQGDVLPEIF